MKKVRRILLISVALAACLALGLGALSEGVLSQLVTSASNLLFDTHNVTLKANATFAYDGELFKTFEGDYVQSDMRSFMRVMLKTPKEDGSVYEGGYTVVGEGGMAYAVDTYNKGYYTTQSTGYSNTILSVSDMQLTMLNFGAQVLDLAEVLIASGITVSDTPEGRQYAVKLDKDTTPPVLSTALTLVTQGVAQRYLGITPRPLADRSISRPCTAEFADWSATFETLYEKTQGEPFPEDFYDRMWGGDEEESKALYALYSEINVMVGDLASQATAPYDAGFSVIAADGSYTHYDTYEEMVLATGKQGVYYTDEAAAIRAYYQKRTGEELTDEIRTVIGTTQNEALVDAYFALVIDMENEYIAQAKADGKAVAVRVDADGAASMIYDIDDVYGASTYNGTPTYNILSSMKALTVDTVDCVFTLDAQGRATGAQGTLKLIVTNFIGEEHTLDIAFSATASDYGTSVVEEFDPADYNVTDFNTFWNTKAASINDVDDPQGDEYDQAKEDAEYQQMLDSLPETIVFDGMEYETMISSSPNG